MRLEREKNNANGGGQFEFKKVVVDREALSGWSRSESESRGQS